MCANEKVRRLLETPRTPKTEDRMPAQARKMKLQKRVGSEDYSEPTTSRHRLANFSAVSARWHIQHTGDYPLAFENFAG